MPDQVQYSPIGVRFGEAIDNLRGKLREGTLRWDDLAGPVHARVFTVAGATSADLLRDLHEAVQKGVTEGQSLSGFRKDFKRIVQEHGWTYRGTPGWRSQIIYSTNMRSAHMAGRWKQLQDWQASGEQVFLTYRTAGDARVRPQHRTWNGLTYPLNDAFWRTHYPPNGWNCRCTVRAYSAGDMQRKGLQTSEPHSIQYRDVVTRDGEITDRVPVGIDPGWDHNVGQSWLAPELSLGQKLARLPAPLRKAVTDKTISPAFQEAISTNWKAFQAELKPALMEPGPALPAATMPPAAPVAARTAGTEAAAAISTSRPAQILGFLDGATLDALESAAPAAPLRSSAVIAFETPAGLPAVWVNELPQHLRTYRAVLLDRVSGNIVIIPMTTPEGADPGTAATIVLRPNVRTRYGTAIVLQAAGTTPLRDLVNPSRYLTLSGRIR